LKPEYEILAKEYHIEGTKVLIAAFDADSNQVPDGFDVQGFPTILFLPAALDDDARPAAVAYNGARSAGAMSAFIEQNANSLKK
jgi:hypothetical protein